METDATKRRFGNLTDAKLEDMLVEYEVIITDRCAARTRLVVGELIPAHARLTMALDAARMVVPAVSNTTEWLTDETTKCINEALKPAKVAAPYLDTLAEELCVLTGAIDTAKSDRAQVLEEQKTRSQLALFGPRRISEATGEVLPAGETAAQ